MNYLICVIEYHLGECKMIKNSIEVDVKIKCIEAGKTPA